MISDRISVGGDINILRIKVSILNMTFKKKIKFCGTMKSRKDRRKRGGQGENDHEPQNGSYSK